MNTTLLSEAEKALIAELQLTADPAEKAEMEFALNDYQDHVSQIFGNCRNMGLSPAQAIMGYISAVAACVYSFTAEPKPGCEEAAAKTIGDILAAHLADAYKRVRS